MISPQEAAIRLEDSIDRPLLQDKDREEKISDLLDNRLGLYEKYAELTIDNNSLSPDEATDLIKQNLLEKGRSV
jgi:shikimate kinase